jgi:hypothetical protein
LEDRLQYLKDNTKPLSTEHDTLATHKTTPDIIQHFADVGDPSKNKQHTQYLVSLYAKKAIRQEDAPSAHETLTNFDKYKSKLKPEERVLSTKTYPTLGDLREKLKPHVGLPATNKEAVAHLRDNLNIPGKHPLVYEDEHVKIYHNADKATAKKIYCSSSDPKPGPHPTEWCTSRDTANNMFDQYLERHGGAYHVIHRKKDGAVWQLHPESNQFEDAQGKTISDEDLLSVGPSLHNAIDQGKVK